jgi:hypothetical protein
VAIGFPSKILSVRLAAKAFFGYSIYVIIKFIKIKNPCRISARVFYFDKYLSDIIS